MTTDELASNLASSNIASTNFASSHVDSSSNLSDDCSSRRTASTATNSTLAPTVLAPAAAPADHLELEPATTEAANSPALDVPLLLIVNKKDTPGAIKPSKVLKTMGLRDIGIQKSMPIQCEGRTGDGIEGGFKWLTDTILHIRSEAQHSRKATASGRPYIRPRVKGTLTKAEAADLKVAGQS